MLARDRLHMTDLSYDCLARAVSNTIARAAGAESRHRRGQPAPGPEDRPAEDAAGLQIVERGIGLIERPLVERHGRHLAGRDQREQLLELGQRADERAFDGDGAHRQER